MAQLQLHWAAAGSSEGSEHMLDGSRFFGEFQIVHYNVKYNNLTIAAKQPDILAILAFFIEVNIYVLK